MAHAGHKHFGPGMQGKGTGTGAMSDADPEDIPANMVLSNRDKAQHSDDRGLDGKAVLTEQMQDHAAARADVPEGADDPAEAGAARPESGDAGSTGSTSVGTGWGGGDKALTGDRAGDQTGDRG